MDRAELEKENGPSSLPALIVGSHKHLMKGLNDEGSITGEALPTPHSLGDLGVGFCQLAHGHLVGNDP